ncbi:hypothetical protein [Pseudoalteromonas luteoviolacea]|uniref:Lipoprotein n=1 Tax=Pseudoalteromonas luteoviolacea (strain 2ta16) TaxID=1353533 RepID=V4HUA9_PSEL2|nr:hypothetical protein [Pseudoalteromonas luteoviolacea]ESP93348.1 hypothetical protein PL2TA16_03201 [Pseudoalteromonas luteoviolacea 2ta16]KZN33629.1 hypothetical protein N483_26290 [Pseudoalteromonas luteoviolacea NCIMB 1944]
MRLSRVLILPLVVGSTLMMGCKAKQQSSESLNTVDSAKIKFHYVKTGLSSSKKGKLENRYTLSVYMDIKNDEINFESESVNSPGIGWPGSYDFYQELDCVEYSHKYLCIPSIKLAIPISKFQSERHWSHNSLNYSNGGLQDIPTLREFGKVFVINAMLQNSREIIYTYYFTLKGGLVAFSKGGSHDTWVLSDKNEFGAGALSLGKSLGVNSWTVNDIKNYSVIKMVR